MRNSQSKTILWVPLPTSRRLIHAKGVIITSKVLLPTGRFTPSLAMRMAPARAVLMRGFAANLAGKGCRQVGQVFFPLLAHLVKHPRQKLCWQGAYRKPQSSWQRSLSEMSEIHCQRAKASASGLDLRQLSRISVRNRFKFVVLSLSMTYSQQSSAEGECGVCQGQDTKNTP